MYTQEHDEREDKIIDLSRILQDRDELKEAIYMLY